MLTETLSINRLSISVVSRDTTSISQRIAVVKALVKRNSIRSTVRLTGVARNTVTKLLVALGAARIDYHDKQVLRTRLLQLRRSATGRATWLPE